MFHLTTEKFVSESLWLQVKDVAAIFFPNPFNLQSLQKLLHLWERLPMVQQLRAHGRRRRAVFFPRPAPSGTKRLAAKGSRVKGDQSRLTLARPTFREEKDPWKPADPARRTLPNHPDGANVVPGHHRATKRGARPPLPSAATEVGAAHEAGCRCPDSQRATVAAQEMEARQGVLRVPTPRTEEAAWAASALTFLLVLLTLAVLYTRLHRKCRRGPSLYWMTSSEEGRETVAGKSGPWDLCDPAVGGRSAPDLGAFAE